MNTQLTVKQAIAEGFEKCGFAGHEWQNLMDISEVTEDDFNHGKIELAEKTPNHYAIDWTEFRDRALDGYFDSDTGDDDAKDIEMLLDEIKPEFEALAAKVNEQFLKRPWWTLTSIELIPDNEA